MEQIVLVGGGGHAKSVIDVLELEQRFQIVGIVDQPENLGSSVLGYPVIGSDDNLDELAKKYKYAFITVGQIKSAALRIKLFEAAKIAGFILPSIVSPRAYVSRHATIDEGSIIMHDALINAAAKIGKNSIINTKALIEHDSIIGDHYHISTGVRINGGVTIEDQTFVGSGVMTKETITIPKNSFIKAGSVVK
ncbi:MAG: acetyltransferase [SAR324 cluster bacterium]|nr:acetyltransferase [SAR324 cluster bacterium]